MTIDWWTLGFQTANVAILIWLLGRFFWRPVAGMIEQRRAEAQRLLAEAEAKRGEAAAALAGVDSAREGFAKEREAILEAARQSAETARTARLAETAKEVAALEAAAKARIEKERDAAEAAWRERATQLAVSIAERLAARLDGPAVRGAFLDWLLDAIRRLPESEREAMAQDGAALEVISAKPLDPAGQEDCRARIGDAFGSHPGLTFKVDTALIAGMELRGAHLVVHNSWRADLTQILAEMTHDDRA
ncbi:MAG: F0F1 ATP synthase subunit delta [Beijerinckiaceae bacterium]|nr:F0F1 ATP synthase subunit delta [Beijerinckiaceae bacterium]